MPPLHQLNPPPHPFWDFVSGIEDHPFFAAYAPRNAGSDNDNADTQQPQQPAATEVKPESSEKARGKQASVEDPPEIDPSTVNPGATNNTNAGGPHEMPNRERGHHPGPFGEGWGRRGRGCRGWGGARGRGGPFGGPPPFMFGPGPHPFWTGPRHHSHPHHQHRGPPRDGPPRDVPSREGEARRPEGGPGGFDLGNFLSDLGGRLGIDLAGAAENLGANNYSAPQSNEEVDFEPRTDIYDTPDSYLIHLSLPGAKKEDVAVDWDGEKSILRITGVVHRPGIDEQLLARLVVNGRKRENGVFEKAIRLGTKRDPASIDVAGISAKMNDGVLVVKVPKVGKEYEKREVKITGPDSNSPAPDAKKDLLFDADEELYDAAPSATPAQSKATSAAPKAAEQQSEKAAEAEAEARDDRSETAGREEQLPRYTAGELADKSDSDWEKDSDEEGEYVKINVD